jgi:hypothetical protein
MTDWWSADPPSQPSKQQNWWDSDAPVGKERAKPQGLLANALEPITSYPGTFAEMNHEARDQFSRGIGQLKAGATFAATPTPEGMSRQEVVAGGAGNLIRGAGNTAMGAMGYLMSPINAGLRTVIGNPIEQTTGIRKEIPEFAASLMLPVPKRIPLTRAVPEVAAVPTAERLGEVAAQGYKDFRAAGGAPLDPPMAKAFAEDIKATLESKGAWDHLATPVHRTVDLLDTGKPVTMDRFKSIREGLNSLKADPDSKVRRAANIASEKMESFLIRNEPEAAESLLTADANYAAMKRGQQLDQAKDVAGLRTGRAGYGGNAVNAMRQVLSPIVEKAIKGKTTGFNTEEIRAMNEIVTGTTATNVLRGVGQLSPSKGAIQTGIAIGSGGATAAAGAAANKLATILTSKQIDRLNELVRKRSPAYEEALNAAAGKFTSAAKAFNVSPSQANLVRTVGAARALSSGLARDGIEISSGNILRSLQSPTHGRTDENEVPREPE